MAATYSETQYENYPRPMSADYEEPYEYGGQSELVRDSKRGRYTEPFGGTSPNLQGKKAIVVDSTRLTGRCLWFDGRKNYGAIQPDQSLGIEAETGHSYIFVHGNDVEAGSAAPRNGDAVEFCRGTCPRGRTKAAKVVVLGGGSSQPSSGGQQAPPSTAGAPGYYSAGGTTTARGGATSATGQQPQQLWSPGLTAAQQQQQAQQQAQQQQQQQAQQEQQRLQAAVAQQSHQQTTAQHSSTDRTQQTHQQALAAAAHQQQQPSQQAYYAAAAAAQATTQQNLQQQYAAATGQQPPYGATPGAYSSSYLAQRDQAARLAAASYGQPPHHPPATVPPPHPTAAAQQTSPGAAAGAAGTGGPTQHRALGRVKWFDRDRKSYGFITPADGSPDLFMHAGDVLGSTKTLGPGDAVEFDYGVQPQSGRPKALEVVRLVQHVVADEDEDDGRTTIGKFAPGDEPLFDKVRVTGTIARFDPTHRWGFIAPDDASLKPPNGGDNFFVHGLDVLDATDGNPIDVGQHVEFAVVRTRSRRCKAVQVLRITSDDVDQPSLKDTDDPSGSGDQPQEDDRGDDDQDGGDTKVPNDDDHDDERRPVPDEAPPGVVPIAPIAKVASENDIATPPHTDGGPNEGGSTNDDAMDFDKAKAPTEIIVD